MGKKSWLAARGVADAVVFVGLVSAAGLLWQRPLVLTAIYGVVILFLLWRRWSPEVLGYCLVGLVLGPMAEYYAVLCGAWSYSGAEFALPIWLPFAWGISGILLKGIGDTVTLFLSRGTWQRSRGADG